MQPRLPFLAPRAHVIVNANVGYVEIVDRDTSAEISVEMAPGDVLLFGPYTIHGSKPNLSRSPRRAFLNGFSIPGANRRIYPGEGAGRTVVAPFD